MKTLIERLLSADLELREVNELPYYDNRVLLDAVDRIQELENVLRTACKADGCCFSQYGACVCRGTDPAQRPPVGHHTRGSVLDYYRTIPKEETADMTCEAPSGYGQGLQNTSHADALIDAHRLILKQQERINELEAQLAGYRAVYG